MLGGPIAWHGHYVRRRASAYARQERCSSSQLDRGQQVPAKAWVLCSLAPRLLELREPSRSTPCSTVGPPAEPLDMCTGTTSLQPFEYTRQRFTAAEHEVENFKQSRKEQARAQCRCTRRLRGRAICLCVVRATERNPSCALRPMQGHASHARNKQFGD